MNTFLARGVLAIRLMDRAVEESAFGCLDILAAVAFAVHGTVMSGSALGHDDRAECTGSCQHFEKLRLLEDEREWGGNSKMICRCWDAIEPPRQGQ